jgi:hypothetical protein
LNVRFQADNDLKFSIVTAVRRREPAIDFASAQDSVPDGVSDTDLLERTAQDNRILVSHDRRTMLDHLRLRLAAGKFSPGLLIASQGAPVGLIAESLVLLWSVADARDLCNQAYYLPTFARHVFPR